MSGEAMTMREALMTEHYTVVQRIANSDLPDTERAEAINAFRRTAALERIGDALTTLVEKIPEDV